MSENKNKVFGIIESHGQLPESDRTISPDGIAYALERGRMAPGCELQVNMVANQSEFPFEMPTIIRLGGQCLGDVDMFTTHSGADVAAVDHAIASFNASHLGVGPLKGSRLDNPLAQRNADFILSQARDAYIAPEAAATSSVTELQIQAVGGRALLEGGALPAPVESPAGNQQQ